MIEITEENRFTNAYGQDHAMFPTLGAWVRWFEKTGVPARLFFHTEGRHKNKYAVYRCDLVETEAAQERRRQRQKKLLPYGHRVDRRVA